MSGTELRKVLIIATIATLLASTSFAHDTGRPHSHQAGEEGCVMSSSDPASGGEANVDFDSRVDKTVTMIFIVVPTRDAAPLQWLWSHMMGGLGDAGRFSIHDFMHWNDIPHSHAEQASGENMYTEGGDQDSTVATDD